MLPLNHVFSCLYFHLFVCCSDVLMISYVGKKRDPEEATFMVMIMFAYTSIGVEVVVMLLSVASVV